MKNRTEIPSPFTPSEIQEWKEGCRREAKETNDMSRNEHAELLKKAHALAHRKYVLADISEDYQPIIRCLTNIVEAQDERLAALDGLRREPEKRPLTPFEEYWGRPVSKHWTEGQDLAIRAWNACARKAIKVLETGPYYEERHPTNASPNMKFLEALIQREPEDDP